jgi:hypothetical protein
MTFSVGVLTMRFSGSVVIQRAYSKPRFTENHAVFAARNHKNKKILLPLVSTSGVHKAKLHDTLWFWIQLWKKKLNLHLILIIIYQSTYVYRKYSMVSPPQNF